MDTFILNNELDFRNYIIKHKNEIMKIIIFEDNLDNIIFFYCFTKKIILASKEINNNYLNYVKIYENLKNELNFKTIINKNKVLKLIK